MGAARAMTQVAPSGARRFHTAVAVAVVTGVVCVAWRLTMFGGERVTVAAIDVISVLAALAAAVACFAASRRRGSFGRAWTMAMRRAWRLVGLSLVAMGVGDLIWLWYQMVRNVEAPCPSLADVAYLGSVPLMAAGVLSFPVAPAQRAARLRTLMDGVLIAGCLLIVSWVLVLKPVYTQFDVPLVERVIELAYPLGDITNATIALILLARTRGRGPAPLWLVALSMGVFAVSDTLFLYLDQTGQYGQGNLIDVGWPVAYLLLVLAPLRPVRSRIRQDAQDQVSLTQLVPSYGVLAVAVTVYLLTDEFDPFLFWVSVVIGALVLLRGVASIVENRRLNQRLVRLVGELSERENQLAHALSRGKAAAEGLQAADAMKDTFLQAVSHDLRNPLAAILGVALTLERTKFHLPRDKAMELLDMLVEKARKLDRLLNDLLDLNRLEQGVLEPDRSPTDVRELLLRVVGEIDQLQGWPVQVDAPAVMAAIDAPKVERIVENLLVNATKHTPPGTPVWVAGLVHGRDLELVVADAGPGVPPELVGSVFEPFDQGGRNDPRGVGIGLSLVARFTQLHGGQAWVSSRTGGGASFHVLLPGTVLPGTPVPSSLPGRAPAHRALPASERYPVPR
jgi:signal transduction histidine kinase